MCTMIVEIPLFSQISHEIPGKLIVSCEWGWWSPWTDPCKAWCCFNTLQRLPQLIPVALCLTHRSSDVYAPLDDCDEPLEPTGLRVVSNFKSWVSSSCVFSETLLSSQSACKFSFSSVRLLNEFSMSVSYTFSDVLFLACRSIHRADEHCLWSRLWSDVVVRSCSRTPATFLHLPAQTLDNVQTSCW